MYRKSSHSIANRQCVEVDAMPKYRKSSYSAKTNCVETASTGTCVLVRDSKDVSIPPLQFDGISWGRFVAGLRET